MHLWFPEQKRSLLQPAHWTNSIILYSECFSRVKEDLFKQIFYIGKNRNIQLYAILELFIDDTRFWKVTIIFEMIAAWDFICFPFYSSLKGLFT